MYYQVGAYAVYTWRHRKLLGHGKESLEQIARVVVLNMVFVCLSTHFIVVSVIAIFFIASSYVRFGRVWVSFQGASTTGVM
jgi:hypothetical protein